jgi:small subunit ribosomal protein S13
VKGVKNVPRIAGVDLPHDKRVEIGLTYIYGVGRSRSNEALEHTGVDPDTRVKNLAEAEISRLREFINRNYVIEGDLRREVRQNVQRLIDINCYRGIRHRRGLPVRGQRTKTNARTRKGPRKTVAGRGRRRGAKKR